MIETKGLKLTFCCARGLNRSVEACELVPGSDCVEDGYVGVHEWLKDKSLEEQLHDISLFYAGTFIVLIADQEDLQYPIHSQALQYMKSLLAQAAIEHVQTPWLPLIQKIGEARVYIPQELSC